MAHKLVIVESPAKARTIGGYLGERLRGRVLHRPHPRPAQLRRRHPGQHQGQAVGPARGRRRQRLHALLRRAARQEEPHRQAQEPAQGRRRALPRHRRGPRGRGDRLAPPRRAEAEGHPGAPDGLPRDHQARRSSRPSRTRARSTTTSSRPRRRAASSTASTATRSRPVLWKKVMSGLSAGRVQSVATRLVVDRERERMAFRVASYWDLEGTFDAGSGKEPRMFPAKLHSIDEMRVAGGSDFGTDGELKGKRQTTASTSTATRPRAWSPRCTTRRTPCGRWSPSPTAARPTRRSAPRRSSRRPVASSA